MIIPASTAIQKPAKSAQKVKHQSPQTKDLAKRLDNQKTWETSQKAHKSKAARAQVITKASNLPASWRAALPGLKKAYKEAPSHAIYQTVAAYLETLTPAPEAFKDVKGICKAAGIPKEWWALIEVMYTPPEQRKDRDARDAECAKRDKEAARRQKREADTGKSPLVRAHFGPDPLDTQANLEGDPQQPKTAVAADGLPKTREECPAFVRKAYETATPDDIDWLTAEAVYKAMPVWDPNWTGSRFIPSSLLDAAGIPKEWHIKIDIAYSDHVKAIEEDLRDAERRRREAIASPAPERPDPFSAEPESAKHGDWIRVTPGEAKDIRSQADVVLGLVDGLTACLEERNPEDRETRKLSALRAQVDNLIELLDPIVTGQEDRGGG